MVTFYKGVREERVTVNHDNDEGNHGTGDDDGDNGDDGDGDDDHGDNE